MYHSGREGWSFTNSNQLKGESYVEAMENQEKNIWKKNLKFENKHSKKACGE